MIAKILKSRKSGNTFTRILRLNVQTFAIFQFFTFFAQIFAGIFDIFRWLRHTARLPDFISGLVRLKVSSQLCNLGRDLDARWLSRWGWRSTAKLCDLMSLFSRQKLSGLTCSTKDSYKTICMDSMGWRKPFFFAQVNVGRECIGPKSRRPELVHSMRQD